jgi:hypothetical protein
MELSSRSCGSCTKCCEGYTSGGAYGIKFGNGLPCHFLEIGLGCTIYEDRPRHPCQTYKCHWLTNIDIPEHFKPEISHIMATRRGQNYIVLTNVGPNPNQEVIDWYLEDASSKGYNLAYRRNDKDSFFGDPDFIAKMYGSLGSS